MQRDKRIITNSNIVNAIIYVSIQAFLVLDYNYYLIYATFDLAMVAYIYLVKATMLIEMYVQA